MSIVAERPVKTQAAGGWSERERALEARRAAAVPAGRRVTSSYTRPERVDLRTAEDRPLSAVQAGRVARLVEEHHDHLVRYVQARLGGWAYWSQAEDVAQEVWLDVARGRVPELLEETPELPWPRLAGMAKWSLLGATTARRRREWLVRVPGGDDRSADEVLESLAGPGPDSTVCAVTELLADSDEEPQAWGGCYAAVIAALPERQREALELRCVEGMTMGAVASRMGCRTSTVQTVLKGALATLRDPQASARLLERREAVRLPAGYERVVARLPKAQREVVVLRVQGLPNAEIARRLGKNAVTTYDAYRRAVANLREMVSERRMDPVQAAPARPEKGAGHCARACATGCHLRTARARLSERDGPGLVPARAG